MQHRLHAPRQTESLRLQVQVRNGRSGFSVVSPSSTADPGAILGEEPSSPVTRRGRLAEDGQYGGCLNRSPRRVISFSSRRTHSPTARPPKLGRKEDAGGAPQRFAAYRGGVGSGQGVSAPASSPRGLFPSDSRTSAHRERDILDAAHGVAVVSRVDSSGEDLMQMHLRRHGR